MYSSYWNARGCRIISISLRKTAAQETIQRLPWHCKSVADLEGCATAHPQKKDRLCVCMCVCVFLSHFVSECLKIRLRKHERASNTPRDSRALIKRALDPGPSAFAHVRCALIIFCAPIPPPPPNENPGSAPASLCKKFTGSREHKRQYENVELRGVYFIT